MNSPASDYVIGIDIGTGSCKALAINIRGQKLSNSQIDYGIQSRFPGYAEQNPEEIWSAFVECIKNTIQQVGYNPKAISLSSAMHGLILIDKDNHPLTPLIIWADKRSEDIAGHLKNEKYARSIYEDTGTPIYSMSPLCKIMWFRKNDPQLFLKAQKFVGIKEFIWFRIFTEWQVDISIASATGLFNIHSMEWNKPSLELCRILPSQLSEPVPTNLIRSDINQDALHILNLQENISFCIGANDGCLANVGSFANDSGVATLTIGTSGAVRVAGNKPVSDFQTMLFNYLLDKQTYISGGPINNGGIVIKWIIKTFLNIEEPGPKDYSSFFKKIQSVPPGSDGLIFLPYLLGERAPVWDAKASALFFGIHHSHTQNHFLRAAVEGVCFAIKDVLRPIEKTIQPIHTLNISGGFIHSPIWMQIMADITDKKLCLFKMADASAMGAAMLVMKQLNWIASYNDLKPEVKQTIDPNKNNQTVYESNFKIYSQLYSALIKNSLQ
ncbi:MAG: gluconokinase [Ginsengibacter sp.]